MRGLRSSTARHVVVAVLCVSASSACGDGSASPPFPEDYESAWSEPHDPCVESHDHGLRPVRRFADDLAYEPYTTFEQPYPPGATLLLVEYEDEACEQPAAYNTMEKLPEGALPELGDWEWRRFDRSFDRVTDESAAPERCMSCHQDHCGAKPSGWDLTCAENPSE